ncbi:MAG: transglutaminase family protein [Eubacterium sp.]|nr:transglutaminase family protein [Eubacterium sp.]
MNKVRYSFSTKLTFDNNVHDHSFALRCVPNENPRQKITAFDFSVSPFVGVCTTVDAFSNKVLSGIIHKDHRCLDFDISGEAIIDSSAERTDFMPCYKYHSHYTKPGETLRDFYALILDQCCESNPYKRAEYFSAKLSEKFSYQKNVTDTETTAEQAFVIGKGVCQDFTHILMSLLRQDGIPCRYQAGLACCDGETHSWVDIWTGSEWKSYDPTNLCEAGDSYLTLSQGRDFRDSAIDRGVMFGGYTRQMQLIISKLEIY